MKLTGHKTRSVFERYNIVSDGDLSATARRLDGLMELQPEKQSSRKTNGDGYEKADARSGAQPLATPRCSERAWRAPR